MGMVFPNIAAKMLWVKQREIYVNNKQKDKLRAVIWRRKQSLRGPSFSEAVGNWLKNIQEKSKVKAKNKRQSMLSLEDLFYMDEGTE